MTLDIEDIAAIAEAVAEKLRAAPSAKPVEAELIGVEGSMKMLGCNTRRTLNRALADLKIKPVRRGIWRIKDITNALARRSLTPAA